MTEFIDEVQADLVRLRKVAGKKEFEKLEEAWMEAIAREGADVPGLLAILETVARRDDESEVADGLFWFLLSEVTDRFGAGEGLKIIRAAAAFLAGSESVREETAAVYQAAGVAPEAEIRVMAEMTVLNNAVPFAVAVRRLDKLVQLRPGTAVLDTQLEKLGQVTRFDTAAKAVEAAFADRPRSYDRLGIDKLEPLPPDDLRARMVSDRTALEVMARERPSELIRTVLGTYGPRLEFRDLKSRLAEIVLQAAWSKFWAEAKVHCKRDPLIEMGEGTQPWLFLRSKPVAYADELKAAFEAAETAEEKLVTVLNYLAECADHPADAGFCQFAGKRLVELVAAWRESQPTMALGALAVLAELEKRAADVPGAPPHALEPLLFGAGEPAALLRPVTDDRLARTLMEHVRSSLHASWHEVWAGAMPGCSQAICDHVARTLVETGHAGDVRTAVGVVLARPERYPFALAWLWKTVCGEKLPEVVGEIKRFDVAISLLAATNHMNREATFEGKQQRDAVSQLKSAVSAKNFEYLRAALKEADEDGAIRAFHVTERNFVLGEHTRVRAMNIISQTHPNLFLKTVPPWEDNDVVYTTEAGLKKRQAEFTHLVHVKMAANAKAIGEAAARGDLSENAEFTAALEERNHLTEKAGRMEAELQKTRVIKPEMAEGDLVTVGSRIVAKDLAGGESQIMIFLGPWDSDPEQGVYSYLAALAQVFMGKKVGDRVELAVENGTRTWEIVEVGAGT